MLDFISVVPGDARLPDNLFDKADRNVIASVRIWDAHLQLILRHELMSSAGIGPREANATKPANQIASGKRG